MDYKIKHIASALTVLTLLLAGSCTRPYESDFDFMLDREEFRFGADEGTSYFLVYGSGHWTTTFEEEVDWVSIDKTSGYGQTQVNVSHEKNEGLSRGVNLFITYEDGRQRTVYLSQKSGLSTSKPAYSLETETMKLLGLSTGINVSAISNIPKTAVDTARIKVFYTPEGTEWISDLKVSEDNVSLKVADNGTGTERYAKIEIAFTGARWDDPYTVFLNITQSSAGPQAVLSEQYALDPLGTAATEITLATNWDTNIYPYDISYYTISDESFLKSVEFDAASRSIKVLPAMNKSKAARTATLTWYAKDSEGNVVSTATAILSQEISPIQMDGEPVNLTDGGKYANCYILSESTEAYYCLEPKMVSGVLPAEDITDAQILWQTSSNVLDYVAYSAAEGLVYLHKPAGVKGNAVVTFKTADGTIRWSLHFWATGESVGECTIGGVTFMDRNIGATATAPPANNESDAAGMHYQWGRKDPFPSAANLSSSNAKRMTVYPDDAVKTEVAQDGVSLTTAIASPGTYYWGKESGKNEENWCSAVDDNLWDTDVKTDYDPCPYGYVVPDKTQIDKAAAAQSNSTKGKMVQCDDGSSNFWCGGGWYRRTTSNDYQIANAGKLYYWTTTTGTYNEKYRGSYALEEGTAKIWARRWGAMVRCVKANN